MTTTPNKSTAIAHDTPVPARESENHWGSDAIAALLREMEIPYIALNPGASYRGLHDSLVNYLGNRAPQMLLCLHDETAVHIAQGYFKASDRMMAAALHSNVGLMHAAMPIFNSWCDRSAVLVIGATGAWDAAKRRPWIEWIHTCSDQGALVRNYTKWDNQPGSVAAALEALLRASQIAQTAPRGPVYVNLDVTIQEEKIAGSPALPNVARYAPPPSPPAPADQIAAAVKLLADAKNPVMLVGRCSRSMENWNTRIALAEKLEIPVLTHIKLAAAFPTDHRLHVAPPGNRLAPEARKLLAEADVILSLDWLDLAGSLKQALSNKPVTAKIINVSCDAHAHRGWSMDYQALPPVDLYMMCDPDSVVPQLLQAVAPRKPKALPVTEKKSLPPDKNVTIRGVGDGLRAALGDSDFCITRLPLGWSGAYLPFRHPLDYVGFDGGGGVGAGPGITVGAALAIKGSGRLPIGLIGDGDFIMGNTSVWTATHYQIPCLMIIMNNRSYFNDERHQEHMAVERGRPAENRWIGQHIGDPDIDLAAMARAQGAVGYGPITNVADIQPAIEKGIAAVREGKACVIDMRVEPGYDAD